MRQASARARTLGWLPLLLLSCAGTLPRTESGAPVSALVLRPVEWNTASVPLVHVRGVVDDGNVVVVVADGGARILVAGALAATDAKATDATVMAVVPGADGTAQWLVLAEASGHLRYLHNLSTFEDVSARYGLVTEAVHGVTALGEGASEFLLDHEIAIADGHHLTRYATLPLTELAGANGVSVGVATDAIVVIRVKEQTRATYPLPHVTHAAVGMDGRVYASTPDSLYASDASGQLSRVFRASHPTLHGLVASRDHVWFADAGELGLVEGATIAETHGANLGHGATLRASSTGDVWVLDGGALQRFQAVATSSIAPAEWSSAESSRGVSAVFARACAACHRTGGVAGLDLSSHSAWEQNRAAIVQRVVVARTMPPGGHTLSDADRAAVEAWAKTDR